MEASEKLLIRLAGFRIGITGPPGSGKGEQARILGAILRAEILSISSLLRKAAAEPDEIGRYIDQTMTRGELVPPDIVMDLLVSELRSIRSSQSVILDGFPRDEQQARESMNFRSSRVFVFLDVPDEVCYQRLTCSERNRADDQFDVLKKRLTIYRSELPGIRQAIPDHLMIDANGDQTVANVTRSIIEGLERVVFQTDASAGLAVNQ